MAERSAQHRDGNAGADGRFLLVGLGNPGSGYAGNRHNIGFLVLDELAERLGGKFKAHKAGAEIIESRLGGSPGDPATQHRVVLAKPRSFMNLSGSAVAGTARFFTVPPARIVVVHDELDLEFGTVRLKLGGGDNGHNGLRSISKSLATREYLRARFGVGRPPGRMDAAQYVLRDFGSAERRDLAAHVDRCADAVQTLVTSGLSAAQNSFHAD